MGWHQRTVVATCAKEWIQTNRHGAAPASACVGLRLQCMAACYGTGQLPSLARKLISCGRGRGGGSCAGVACLGTTAAAALCLPPRGRMRCCLQYSVVPEEDEPGVKFFLGYADLAPETTRRQAGLGGWKRVPFMGGRIVGAVVTRRALRQRSSRCHPTCHSTVRGKGEQASAVQLSRSKP